MCADVYADKEHVEHIAYIPSLTLLIKGFSRYFVTYVVIFTKNLCCISLYAISHIIVSYKNNFDYVTMVTALSLKKD